MNEKSEWHDWNRFYRDRVKSDRNWLEWNVWGVGYVMVRLKLLVYVVPVQTWLKSSTRTFDMIPLQSYVRTQRQIADKLCQLFFGPFIHFSVFLWKKRTYPFHFFTFSMNHLNLSTPFFHFFSDEHSDSHWPNRLCFQRRETICDSTFTEARYDANSKGVFLVTTKNAFLSFKRV